MATAQLLGDDDAGVGSPRGLPLLVQGSEVTNVEGKNSSTFRRGEGELFFVGRRIVVGFFGPDNVVTAAAQVHGQPGHDMAVEVEPNVQRLNAG